MTTKVTCTGPESSGTRLLTRLVSGLGVVAVHRSVPHGPEWWPRLDDTDSTHMVVITRDIEKTLASQKRAGHMQVWQHRLSPQEKYDLSVGVLIRQTRLWGRKALWIEYEDLVAEPQRVMDAVAAFLGVEPRPVTEEIDQNR